MILPADFEIRMQKQLGNDYHLFKNALDEPVPVSVRINPAKWPFELPQLDQVNWCSNAFYLDHRPVFSSDPLWHAGAYYVQEASSMSIEVAFKKIKALSDNPLKILDLCAAPGGKSTHLASLMSTEDLLVSNEVIRSRVQVLSENLLKQSSPNTIVTNADSEEFAKCGPVFDVILVDAPCSGEGLFRKDPNAVNEWSLENIQTCELRQKRILENANKSLKNGGFLIYSTCTYNPGENQRQIESLLENGFEIIPLEIQGKTQDAWQFMPHQMKGEGFFIALLRKSTETVSNDNRKPKYVLKSLKPDESYSKLTNLNAPFINIGKTLYAVPEHILDFYNEHLFNLSPVNIGQTLGTTNDKLFQVSEYLPFSLNIQLSAFETFELELPQAIQYLAKNTLPWSDRNSKGYVILTFKNLPIGLGKFAGNRINNLFPNEWKLRKIPDPNSYFSLLG